MRKVIDACVREALAQVQVSCYNVVTANAIRSGVYEPGARRDIFDSSQAAINKATDAIAELLQAPDEILEEELQTKCEELSERYHTTSTDDALELARWAIDQLSNRNVTLSPVALEARIRNAALAGLNNSGAHDAAVAAMIRQDMAWAGTLVVDCIVKDLAGCKVRDIRKLAAAPDLGELQTAIRTSVATELAESGHIESSEEDDLSDGSLSCADDPYLYSVGNGCDAAAEGILQRYWDIEPPVPAVTDEEVLEQLAKLHATGLSYEDRVAAANTIDRYVRQQKDTK